MEGLSQDVTILVICKTGRFPRVQFFDFNTDPPYELHIRKVVSSPRHSSVLVRAYVLRVAGYDGYIPLRYG